MRTFLAVDPGFTAAGMAVMDIDAGRVVESITVRTQDKRPWSSPRDGGKRKRKGSSVVEDGRRLIQIAVVMNSLIREHDPVAVAIEAFGGGGPGGMTRGTRAVRVQAYVYGLSVGLGCQDGRPLKVVSVASVKKALTGASRGADKAAMIAAALARHPELNAGAITEHVADAVGVYYAALPWLQERLGVAGGRAA